MLFKPYKTENFISKNRVVMAPMCTYKAEDGLANMWHIVHYASRAIGQVGTIIIEATAVDPLGRISDNDLGLWNDEQIEPLAKVVRECQIYGAKVGVQLAHAGRKSRAAKGKPLAPSPIAFNDDLGVPKELSVDEIQEIEQKFGNAALRAHQAGCDFIEIHAAHGYLINEFLSPLSNCRTDKYGIEKQLFLKEVLEKVKENYPDNKAVFIRVSAEEYSPEGNNPESLAAMLAEISALYDILHVSSGGVVLKEDYFTYPAYQLEYAKTLKLLLNKPVIAVGMLEDPKLAYEVISKHNIDLVALGRALLSYPHWVLHAAKALNKEVEWIEAYKRAKHIR